MRTAAAERDGGSMVRHSELIVGQGRLTAEADLPVPCSDPEFVLSVRLDDAARIERVEFLARSPSWRWTASDVEWTHRTDAWLHFGGTGLIDSTVPCRYRATARVSVAFEIVHLELRVYALVATGREANLTPFIVLRGVALGGTSHGDGARPEPDG